MRHDAALSATPLYTLGSVFEQVTRRTFTVLFRPNCFVNLEWLLTFSRVKVMQIGLKSREGIYRGFNASGVREGTVSLWVWFKSGGWNYIILPQPVEFLCLLSFSLLINSENS